MSDKDINRENEALGKAGACHPEPRSKTVGRKASDRQYMVSTNRGAASHRVRYLESGGAEANESCRVCKPTLKPK